jgi:UDP-glucose 4-epimerase
MRKVLVIGGCGYIGSHMVKCLLNAGHDVTVLDDLSTGYEDSLLGGKLITGDFGSRQQLDSIFQQKRFDGVLHFASLIQVGESVAEPSKYYLSNVGKTLVLLDALRTYKINSLIFSSSAAVFGEPDHVPISEDHACRPMNPYGKTKYMVEQALQDFSKAYGLRSVSLRYFNAAGADPEARIGERHNPETHLIPLVLRAAAGAAPALKVFGRDYDTPDGTCIRDYIHVDDLCEAHLLALNYLWDGGETTAFNLGNGGGFSVQQVIDTARQVTGLDVPFEDAERRAGDPARLVADSARAVRVLGWKPEHSSIESIIRHAWQWEQTRQGSRQIINQGA